MTSPLLPRIAPAGFRRVARWLAVAGCLALSGCLSSKYQPAPPDTPPPAALDLTGSQAGLAGKLESVIVLGGPGSWRRQAYWDEYVLSLSNAGNEPLVVVAVSLVDGLGTPQPCGDNPWRLEQSSRANLQLFEHQGRAVLAGAGLTALWVTSVGLHAASSVTFMGTTASAGGATAGAAAVGMVAIPVWAIGSGLRTYAARSAITDEFNRRRLPLPLRLPEGGSRHGSWFFPVSPGPQRLLIEGRTDRGERRMLTIDLAPISGLHLVQAPPARTRP